MKLPQQAVSEFQSLYKSELGTDISQNESEMLANNFLNLVYWLDKNEPNEYENEQQDSRT